MPELPEAETIARSLAPHLVGRRIAATAYPGPRVLRGGIAPDLAGCQFTGVERYGKQLVLRLGDGHALLVKLGMTGALLLHAAPDAYTRAVFTLDTGAALLFRDIRQFGSLSFFTGEPRGLGPDPFDLTAAEFAGRLRAKQTRLKVTLLNQQFLRGLGNIYVDEALHRARLHPLTRAARLTAARAEALHAAIVELLTHAIAERGSSISDYVDGSGLRGNFQNFHRVYGREGQPCVACGEPIVRLVVAQRGTHLCPVCQTR
ncbi:MAG: bifunctional DNA-formamidopyrimidine glycosylase/DNA-(apurinic or apyrimidinic site) lyase [Bryobacterales bacterium]|nr:bifunctional DNA-formamidopyrimidine glycosylase/DNA-(apurinic or apyrimidinic site) lyase [Bryobacterales bacterium]